jgi:SAM-dependent methyltransferase
MNESEKTHPDLISTQNKSYYDEIAAGYDGILNEDPSNYVIRANVTARFKALVKRGTMMDFGGGTGRDLDWLVQEKYRIIFCEPSAGMRKIAMARSKIEFPEALIRFLDESETDFRKWNAGFPFEQKLDGVLANFAVINCIPDIELLFEKLAGAVTPGGIVLALVLEASLIKRLQSNLKGTIRSFFYRDPVSFFITYTGKRQQVYLHSHKEIQKAVGIYFELKHRERMTGSGFSLIHLVRK